MTQHDDRAGAPVSPAFDPVPLRYRHDGWTPERQVLFIRALAESGCVRDACRSVGMSPESAYALARREDAQSFRVAWELALDNAVRRIADEAISRCINGVPVPHFYKGEQVGEHRRYDDRLAMFLLRYRNPHRYGRHLDRLEPQGFAETQAQNLGHALEWVLRDAVREGAGLPRFVVDKIPESDDDAEEFVRLHRAAREDRRAAARSRAGADLPPDVASGSSGSGSTFPSGEEHD
ncbi:hypothetical protein [Sphingosinicella sp.]|uniref:hypothetical protein n=1 Tax=Sphingosinicella sp. TaxID=1917971 RepID=UPI004037B4DD